jgi:hypothetical protein
VVDEIPTLRRHADEVRDLLAFDDFESLAGIPLVHDHQLEAGNETTHQHRNAPGDMEQRHDENERRREWIGLGLLGCTYAFDGLPRRKRHQRADDGTMRGYRTLRATRGTRGVENGCVVIGNDFHRWRSSTEFECRLPAIMTR